MEKVLRLYKYIDGINDIAFPNEKEQAIITSFRYDAKRMGAAPTINFSLMHSLCLDSLWDNKVYALFNGERFYVKQTPTSSYSSSDTRYKHEVELVSERFILDNIYFYDAVSSSSQDKPVSNNSKFSFFGNIEKYISRLNNSLNKSNVGYSIVIDDDILSDKALMSIESQVTFEDQVITNALQEIYNVYKIPYYFVGKIIHVGYYQDNIDTVFKYGCKNSLISISKTNANSKIINKITGVGSSDNIPYYYPNVDEKGITQVLCNGREGIAKIIDLAKYRKVKLADKFVFHETIQSLVPLIDEDDYSFGDFRDEGVDGDGKQRVSIDFYYSFTLQQYESVEFSVTTTYADSLDLRYEIFNPSGQYVGYYKEDKTMQLTGGNYQFVIRWSFLSKEPMIGSDDVIKNFVSQYLNIKANIVVNSSNAWTMNNIPVTLSDYGISVNSPSDGDVLTIERLAYIQPQPNLVPPIYRNTEGGERFYEAINGKYKNEQGEYYQFDNEYTPTNPREHIENFDDIKPTIKNVVNDSGDYIDEFIDFAYDLDDNDETDESGKFIHPYFFGKLRRFDGEFGFNLFDHAIDEGEMVVSMTSGTCGSCEFVIGVDEQSQKNKVQVDSDGNLVRDNNGNVRRTGTPQDRQNDTKNNEVWIALKKDIQTFGVVMPNAGNNYRPKAKDKFVLLHIDLPQKYVEAAENALKDKLIKYMYENNFEKFNFSIAFSRIYFAENPTILANLSENSKIQIEYNKNIYDLYISSLSYSIANDSALPEVKVELEDALSISQNQITQVVESTKREIISSIDKNVFWGDIKGVPTWITSDKPRYSYSELSGRGTSDNSNDVWVVKKDAQGNSYVYTKLEVVVERGVTMYGNDGSVDVTSIFDGLRIDNDTIYWEEVKDEGGNVISKVLKSRGVGEGGVTPTLLGDLKNVGSWANVIATEDRIMVQKKDSSSWEALELSKIGGSASFENVKESGEGNAFTSFVPSEDKKTLTFVKGQTFALQTELDKKWTTDNVKIANWNTAYGWGDHSKANYAKKSTTLAGYGITDAYTKIETNNLLANKWTQDNGKIANWDSAYSWGNHAQAGYFKSADFTKNKIKTTLGISDWALALTKPSYTTKEVAEDTNLYFTNARAVSALSDTLKGYVTLSGAQTISGEKNFTGGLKVNGSPIVYNATGKYWKLTGDLLVTGGITMFGSDSSFSPSTITQAVNVDGTTIINDGKKLMLNPDIQLGGGSDIDLSEYAKKATTLAGYGIADAYTKTEVNNNFIAKATKDFMKVNGSLTSNVDFNDYYTSGSYNNTTGNGSGNSNTPGGYGLMLVFGDKSGYAAQLHVNAGSTSAKIRTRYVHSGNVFTWSDWNSLAYTTSNVESATRLETPRSIWGQLFDGSADINNTDIVLYQNASSSTGGWARAINSRDSSGAILSEIGFYGVGDNLTYTFIGSRWNTPRIAILANGKIGVGTTTPQYEFDVNGSTRIQGTSIVRSVRPELNNSYGLGDSSYLWANLYTKKANIDGIEIKKSKDGVLYIGGNLVVSGGVTMYGTDGTTANTIWDSAPIASTSVKGIASFDSNYFAVNNGKVTFVGQTGGGVADSVAWGNVTGKPTWLGSNKPSYTTSEVAEGTNLYFTNARAVSALSSTLSNYLPLSGGTLTDKLTGTTIVANDLYWREYKNKTLSSGGWYRFATSTRPDSYGNTYILSICRVYNSTSNESYLIAVTLDYSGCSFTQLAGHRYSTAAQLVTKIRCTRTHSGDVYFDFYYTGSSQNTVYVNAIGHCKVQTPEATSSTLTYTDEFSLDEGVKSSLGFIGDLKGNADTATSATTATTASKLGTVSKTAWGQTYWTSGGVPTTISGNMSNVGNITPTTNNTYSIGSYGNGFAWSNFNCISSGAVSNNLWLCGGTTNGMGVVVARSNSNTATGELCRFTEQGMVWASGVIPAIVSTAQEIHLKYNNADATSIAFNGASFKPFISASDNIMLGRYDSLWRGLFLSTDASVPRTEKGVTFCSSNGYAEGKIGANSSGIGIYTVGGLYLRGGCTKGANGTMTESSTGAVIDVSGNMLVTGGVTMYSDLRKKTILNYVELSLKEVADAPLIEHYYNSDEKKTTHVGSVAQYWAELNDWFCKEDEEGFLTMEIQNAALASAISVARELTRYESKTDKQIKKLKKRIGELEEEIDNLKKV